MIIASPARRVTRFAAHVLASALIIVSGHPVYADTSSLCAQAGWVQKLSATDWKEEREVPQKAEVMAFTLYSNNSGEQQLVVGYYNVIWAGEIKIIHQGSRYNTAFTYRVHGDTTGPIDGPTVLVTASYDAESAELNPYCYEIQSGADDIAKDIAHDVLLFVLNRATELLD